MNSFKSNPLKLFMNTKKEMNVWTSVKTTEFPKEKKFDFNELKGFMITTNLKGNRRVTYKEEEVIE